MSLAYGWEKLFSACHYAVGSNQTPQRRLAAVMSIYVLNLEHKDLPNLEAWERFRKLKRATSCKPPKGDEGTIAATTAQMTDEEAGKWLSEIMSLFSEVAEKYGRLRAGEAQIIPIRQPN